MRAKSRVGASLIVVVVAIVLVAATASVGFYAWHADQGRRLQLHDDDVGRQREDAVNAAHATTAKALADDAKPLSAHGRGATAPASN